MRYICISNPRSMTSATRSARKSINYANVIARDQQGPSVRSSACASPTYVMCTDSDDLSGSVNPLIRDAPAPARK